jgi:hypothetical protein
MRADGQKSTDKSRRKLWGNESHWLTRREVSRLAITLARNDRRGAEETKSLPSPCLFDRVPLMVLRDERRNLTL